MGHAKRATKQNSLHMCSPHLGRISVDVDDGGADHFGQVRRVVSGPAAVLGRREPHLRFRFAACIETVSGYWLCSKIMYCHQGTFSFYEFT